MRIGVDYDGVIADCTAVKQQLSREWYGKELKPEQCTTELAKLVIGKEEYERIYKMIESGELALKCMPTAGVQQTIGQLIGEGHKIIILTSLDVPKVGNAKKFLALHKIPFHHWISMPMGFSNLTSKNEKVSKAELMEKFDIDVLIDDDYRNLIKASGTGRLLLLFDQPWNRHLKIEEKDIHRVNGWSDVLRFVHDYSKILE